MDNCPKCAAPMTNVGGIKNHFCAPPEAELDNAASKARDLFQRVMVEGQGLKAGELVNFGFHTTDYPRTMPLSYVRNGSMKKRMIIDGSVSDASPE